MFFVALLELQETLSELEGDYGLAGFNIFYFVWVLSLGIVSYGLFAYCEATQLIQRLTNISGDLQSVDGYMNIALERCREISEGKVTRNWGDAFVRGNNGKHPLSIPVLFRSRLYYNLFC